MSQDFLRAPSCPSWFTAFMLATIPTLSISFQIDATSGPARAGRLTTPHGVIETPVFMPVGTVASVKGVSQDILEDTRRADPSGQYLSPLSAAGSGAGAAAGRPARFHVVAARDSHRLGRLPGLQPERTAQGQRRRRDVSFASGRLFAFLQPGERDGGADRAGRRHHHGVRRVHGVSRRMRARARQSMEIDAALGGAQQEIF